MSEAFYFWEEKNRRVIEVLKRFPGIWDTGESRIPGVRDTGKLQIAGVPDTGDSWAFQFDQIPGGRDTGNSKLQILLVHVLKIFLT